MQVPSKFRINGVSPATYIIAIPSKDKEYEYQRNDIDIVVTTIDQQKKDYRTAYAHLKKEYDLKGRELRDARDSLEEYIEFLDKSSTEFAQLKHQKDSLQRMIERYFSDNSREMFLGQLKKAAAQISITDYQSLSDYDRKIYDGRVDGNWEYIKEAFEIETKGNATTYLREKKERANEAVNDLLHGCKVIEDGIQAYLMIQQFDSVAILYDLLVEINPMNYEYAQRAGDFYSTYLADFGKALECYRNALDIAEAPLLKAETLANIGNIFYSMEDYGEAINLYTEASVIHESMEEDRTANLYLDKMMIGYAYYGLDSMETGARYMFDAIDIINSDYEGFTKSSKKKFKDYEQDAADDLLSRFQPLFSSILALSQSQYEDQKMLTDSFVKIISKADELINELIPLMQSPEDKIGIPGVYSMLAVLRWMIEDFDAARDYFEKGLAVEKELYYPDHPDIGSSYENLGDVCALMSDNTAALEYYISAMEIYDSFWGEGHRKTLELVDKIQAILEGSSQ